MEQNTAGAPAAAAALRIVELAPCRVAAAHGFGTGPEGVAWDKLLTWMRGRGLGLAGARFLGFNNPNPSPGTPEYGYEQWLVLDSPERLAAERAPAEPATAAAAAPVAFKDFPGGRYAVLTHRGRPDFLPRTWSALVAAVERSPYRSAPRQCLELCLTPELLGGPGEPDWEKFAFDLYIAVER